METKCLWITGLPSAGKSTLALAINSLLEGSVVLDSDNLREGLCRDLSFSLIDRNENCRRIAEVANLFVKAGITPIVACISPTRSIRNGARMILDGKFVEVYINADVKLCSARDAKGLYARAANGTLPNLTGVGSPYEVPDKPEIIVSPVDSPIESAKKIIEYLKRPKTEEEIII